MANLRETILGARQREFIPENLIYISEDRLERRIKIRSKITSQCDSEIVSRDNKQGYYIVIPHISNIEEIAKISIPKPICFDFDYIQSYSFGERERLEEQIEMHREVIASYNHSVIDELTNLQDYIKGNAVGYTEAELRHFARQMLGVTGNEEREDSEQVERLYFALTQFQDPAQDARIDARFLADFLKQCVIVSDAQLAKYQLRQDTKPKGSHYGRRFSGKYFDTTFNFCLTYCDQLIASVGFDAQDERIYIGQIQGIKGMGEYLRPFKWERALVQNAVSWAKIHGIPEVAVVSVDNNAWTNKHGHLDREQGKMLYDVTAKRCGFKKQSNGDYLLVLSPRSHDYTPNPEDIYPDEVVRPLLAVTKPQKASEN